MSVRMMGVKEIPKRQRIMVPRIMQTVDWEIARSKLADGLKPQKAIVIVLTPDEMAKYHIKNIRTAVRPIKRHIKTYGLPYSVEAKTTAEGGTIIIANRAAC